MINNIYQCTQRKVNLWTLKSKFLMIFVYHQKFIIFLKKIPSKKKFLLSKNAKTIVSP